jgi:ectoine hydroxylase-related dioxygenase (phytanoyl-CoA dioxygenase family)
MNVPTFRQLRGWPKTEVSELAQEIDRLGLMRNVAELELYGFTVVDAAVTGASQAAQRAFDAAIDLHEHRTGVRPDVRTGSTHTKTSAPVLWHFVHEHPAFQELLLNPVGLALVSYIVGRRAMLSESAVFMKGPHGTHGNALSLAGEKLQLGLHCDYILRPPPFPPYVEECNLTFTLTDYTVANGAIALVPGSHRQRRYPLPADRAEEEIVAVEAPKGSIILINDATWHGSLPSTVPGLRVGMAFRFCRPYVWRRERFDDLPAGFFEGKPERLRELMGGFEFHPVDHGPKDIEQFKKFNPAPTVYS